MSNEIYMIKFNQVYYMDCIEGMKLIDSKTIDLIITDPPFNQSKKYENHNDNMNKDDYLEWCELWIKEGFRSLKDTGSFYIQINSKNIINLGSICNKYGILQNICIWIKHSSPTPSIQRYAKNYQAWLFYTKTNNYKFLSNSEYIYHRYEPYKCISGRNENGRKVDDIWEDISELSIGYLASKEVLKDKNDKKIHNQQMPISLAKRMILHSSEPNDVVLDLFMGTGTTAIACLETNRNFIGFENDSKYYEVSNNRIKNIINQMRFE